MIRAVIRRLRALQKRFSRYEPLIEVLVSRERILHNLEVFQRRAMGCAIAPVLKSNAYGHGLREVGTVLDGARGVPFLCVDSLYEAALLRKEGIGVPLLVLGYTPPGNLARNTYNRVSFSIVSMPELRMLAQGLRSRRNFHLEVDTGMNRHGIKLADLEEAIALIRKNKHMVTEGIFSHFADADVSNSALTTSQVAHWNKCTSFVRSYFPVHFIHIAATAGSRRISSIDSNVIRLGLGLYGIDPAGIDTELLPALSMKTRIASLHDVEAGESIGYNAAFIASRKMRIATVPAGYFEGVPRKLSNKGYIMVRDTPCPIVGRVSMNITSLDVSEIQDIQLGEEAWVIGGERNMRNSVEAIAKACGAIPYEVLVYIPMHLRRRITDM